MFADGGSFPIVGRRAVLATGAALLLPRHLSAASPLEPGALALVTAVNTGDERVIAAWAREAMSFAALARRSAAEWGSRLAAIAGQTGRWRLLETARDGRRIRVTLATDRQTAPRRFDMLVDREAPGRLFDLRPAFDPLPYPRALATIVDREMLRSALARRLAFAIRHNGFSGTMVVADPVGRVQFAMSHGIADVERNTSNVLDTRFNLGSADKSFTAVLIAQLIESGLLQFDTTVAEVIPALRGSPLGLPTVEQLLAHRAGLGEPKGGVLAYSRAPYDRVQDLVPAIEAQTPAFPPGSRTAYSNEGYVLLGAVIEAVTTKPWWTVLEERIYRRVGMTRSGHFTRDELRGKVALGYHPAPDDPLQLAPLQPNDGLAPWRGNSCGGGYSTTPDAIAWLQAFRSDRLVSAAMRTRLIAFTGYPHPDLAYGLGFVRRQVGEHLWVGHSGGGVMVGIGSAMAVAPDTGWAVAVLTNRDVPVAEALLADAVGLVPTAR